MGEHLCYLHFELLDTKGRLFFVLFQMDSFLTVYSHAKFSGGGLTSEIVFLLGNVHMLCCDPLIEHLKAISMLHANT